MFWNKKDEPSPLGVPLGDLMVMLLTYVDQDEPEGQHPHGTP